MKNSLLAGVLAVAALSSASVFAQAADTSLSRAQVKAELVAANKNGQLDVVRSESYPQLLPYQSAQRVGVQSDSNSAMTQANASRVRTQ
jgi:hypothetical protein